MKKTYQVTAKKEINTDYIIFDGDNVDQVLQFVEKYDLYGNDTIDDSYELRPSSIPNLNEKELLKWWISEGEVGGDPDDYKPYNPHNRNNMPSWRKNELLKLTCKSKQQIIYGYVRNYYIGKDTAIVIIDGVEYFVTGCPTPSEVNKFIINKLKYDYDSVEPIDE